VPTFKPNENSFRCPCSLCNTTQLRLADLRQVPPDTLVGDSEPRLAYRNMPIRRIPRLAETRRPLAVYEVSAG
jgi:hypothetical protein